MKNYLGILSVALSGFGIYLFDKIWGDQINWEEFRKVSIGKFLSTTVTVLEILIFLCLFLTIYLILRNISKKKSIYTRKQRRLRKYNNTNAPQTNILLRWVVYFDFSGNPLISDLEAFCDRHGGPPIRFVHNRCPDPSCSNHSQPINPSAVKNYIESDLIDRWNRMN